MADEKRAPHSLKEQTADQIRNEQRGGAATPVDPAQDDGPEANATMRRVWSEPGGEAHSFRNATIAAGTKADGHGDLTAAETPEATARLGDATLKPEDLDATAEAIARASSEGAKPVGGQPGADRPRPTADADEAASHLGQEDADRKKKNERAPQGGASNAPRQPGGIGSGLQPGGVSPGGGPGASVGSIGTGGGQTGGAPSGSVKKSGR